jgi:hypothetical protein
MTAAVVYQVSYTTTTGTKVSGTFSVTYGYDASSSTVIADSVYFESTTVGGNVSYVNPSNVNVAFLTDPAGSVTSPNTYQLQVYTSDNQIVEVQYSDLYVNGSITHLYSDQNGLTIYYNAPDYGDATGSSVMSGYYADPYIAPTAAPTFVDPACYLSGTNILTVQGEVAVEDLKVGDLLPTLSGKDVSIKWIGKQQFMGYFFPKEKSPVCIHAGALGEGLPLRDLHVSAGHSMKIGDYLVDARVLVNGVTITQHKRAEQIEYYHIDLGEHHCIRAEGAWAESYAECNNRNDFYNVNDFNTAHPHREPIAWTEKCLPHVSDQRDPMLPVLLQGVLVHIPHDRITTDADLHLLADGKRLDAYVYSPQAYTFKIPLGTQVLTLQSRTSSPRDIGLSDDLRQLGFCINSLTSQSEDGTFKISIEPHHAKLYEGFHQSEGTVRRWTQGNALLPNALLGDGTEDMILTIKGSALNRYHICEVEIRRDENEIRHIPKLRMVH